MFEVVTIGSSLVDLYIESDEFKLSSSQDGVLLCSKYGDKIDVSSFTMTSGGGASNTSVGFARQGFKTAVITELGRDPLAQVILEDFAKHSVETAWVVQEKREETGMSVILIAPDGGRTVMVNRGASSMLENNDVPWLELEECRWVHATNLSGQLELLQHLLYQVQQTPTLGMSWNPGKADLRLITEGKLSVASLSMDMLCVNQEEWEMLAEQHSELRQQVPLIIITRGREGGVVLEKNGAEHPYEIIPVPTKDETGAGDAFAVGFVSAHLRGEGLAAAIELGRKNAASVAQNIGAKDGLLKRL